MATYFSDSRTHIADYTSGTLNVLDAMTQFGDPLKEFLDDIGDVFHMGGGNDVVIAGPGDDAMEGGLGSDVLRGGEGDDVFVFRAEEVSGDTIDGGAGIDLIQTYVDADFRNATVISIEHLRYLAFHPSIPANLRFNASQVGGTGLASNLKVEGAFDENAGLQFLEATQLDLSGFTFFSWDYRRDRINISGTEDSDTIVGSSAKDIVQGGGGADRLFGNGFNPDGTIKASSGDDALNGEAGDDQLFASNGRDVVDGGDGDDRLVGGSGDDTLSGGIGVDLLFGGAFTPALVFAPVSGNDTIDGGDGNDGIWGQDGDDHITGGRSDDYIEGGEGADWIDAGNHNDVVRGGGGDDTLLGGRGFDYLYGGGGADTFVYFQHDSADWILDFSSAQDDVLRLLGFGYEGFAALPLVDISMPGNPAVQFTYASGGVTDQFTIFGVTLAQLNATNVLVA